MSLSLGLACCAGPQQLLYYSSRQGSLAEPLAYKVQYKRTVGSPGELARKSLAKLNPHQPSLTAHANGTTHMRGAFGHTNPSGVGLNNGPATFLGIALCIHF